MRCLHDFPVTNFHTYANNPVERVFAGRIPLVSGTAYGYFTRGAMVQRVLHALKYKGNKEAGRMLGRMMGQCLLESRRFDGVEALAPVPLHAARERARGYNQSAVICEGIAEVMGLPVITNALTRLSTTGTQTHRNRIERWQHMEGKFRLAKRGLIEGRHMLLVDDVITTGATMEACARALLPAGNVKLSVAALAWADG